MALLAFGVVTQLGAGGDDGQRLEDCRGLAWRRPLLAVPFVTALLALAGLPPTFGFVGRYYLFAAALEADLSLLLVALLVAGALGLYVHLRVIAVLFADAPIEQPKEDGATAARGWPVWLVLCLLAGALIAFGVYPEPVVAWVHGFVSVPLS